MAFFSNGCEGAKFNNQCLRCKYGDTACPIAWIQTFYNYKACNNEVATQILNELVKDDGTCVMFEFAKKDFEIHEPLTFVLEFNN